MDNTLVRTDIKGKAVVERRHWSYSALNNFYNCARKFYNYDVAKILKEPDNPAMNEGFRVHKAMSDYINDGTPLPAHYARYADWVTTMRTHMPNEKIFTEHKMACTFNLDRCDYFSRIQKVWLRAQADLLVINEAEALSVDWKTGKEPDPRYELLPKNFQLRLTGLLVFLHFPKVDTIKCQYVYLNEGTSTSFDMPRADLREFIPQVYEYATPLQQAVRTGLFPPRPSGLCKKHCAVISCEYHGKGSGGARDDNAVQQMVPHET